MKAVVFDEMRANEFVAAIENGRPLKPLDNGWHADDLMLLAAAAFHVIDLRDDWRLGGTSLQGPPDEILAHPLGQHRKTLLAGIEALARLVNLAENHPLAYSELCEPIANFLIDVEGGAKTNVVKGFGFKRQDVPA